MRRTPVIEGYHERLNEAINNSGMTKKEIVDKIGCVRHLLYRSSGMMHPVYLARFCAVTHTDANWLLGITRYPWQNGTALTNETGR